MTWKPAQRAPVGQIWVNLDRKRKIMIYKTLNKKGSLQFIVTFSNKKRRERKTNYYGRLPANQCRRNSRIRKITISQIPVSLLFQARMTDAWWNLWGRAEYWQIGYSPSLKGHKWILMHAGKGIFEHLLNKVVKLPPPIKEPSDIMPFFWRCNRRQKPHLCRSLAKKV